MLRYRSSARKGYGVSAWVYIMASRRNGTIYTGVTSDLQGRVWEHKNDATPGFTSRYGCKTLVWYEHHDGIERAIQREKSIKRYRRTWKLRLIEQRNPNWDDLFEVCYEREHHVRPACPPPLPALGPRDGARG